MGNSIGAIPVSGLKGMPVVSIATGNRLGIVENAFLDPAGGGLSGLSLSAESGLLFAPCTAIHSFGPDAVMAGDEALIAHIDDAFENTRHEAKRMVGARVITESGSVMGRLSNIYLSLKPPPTAIYRVRRSLLDTLLGRELYIPAAAVIAVSDDFRRLVIADTAATDAAHSLRELDQRVITVRSYTDPPPVTPFELPDDEDETVVRRTQDEDETVVRLRDEDDTVIRLPRKAG